MITINTTRFAYFVLYIVPQLRKERKNPTRFAYFILYIVPQLRKERKKERNKEK
jgi:hypothetical protein